MEDDFCFSSDLRAAALLSFLSFLSHPVSLYDVSWTRFRFSKHASAFLF